MSWLSVCPPVTPLTFSFEGTQWYPGHCCSKCGRNISRSTTSRPPFLLIAIKLYFFVGGCIGVTVVIHLRDISSKWFKSNCTLDCECLTSIHQNEQHSLNMEHINKMTSNVLFLERYSSQLDHFWNYFYFNSFGNLSFLRLRELNFFLIIQTFFELKLMIFRVNFDVL